MSASPATFHKAMAARQWLDDQKFAGDQFPTRAGRMAEMADIRHGQYKLEEQDIRERVLESLGMSREDATMAALAHARAEIEAELPGRDARRQAELQLMDYIEQQVQPWCRSQEHISSVSGNHYADLLTPVITAGRNCRQTAKIALKPDGGHLWMYDFKCGKSRLCPDEAREEMMRLAEHYAPQIYNFAAESRRHRVFYAVLTFPHAEPGRLGHHLKYVPSRFVDLVLDAKRPCTDQDRAEFGYSKRKKLVHRFRPGFDAKPEGEPYKGPGIRGALVVTESPLSKGNRWNVHLNILLLVDGEFSYKELYECWRDGAEHLNLDIREINAKDPYELACACREVIKYAAAHTGTKSAEKAAQGASKAPPMTAWPPELWVEWYEAHRGYRRARAYGCLYNCPDEAPEENLDDAVWVGEAVFSDQGEYWVDLIPDDKFLRSGLSKGWEFYHRSRPPPDF